MDAQKINHLQAVARRRKTVFRKLRQLCLQYNYKAVVLIADEHGNTQWLYKTHDRIPGFDQVSNIE
jgi:rRNA maturation protein Rpf1